MKYHKNITPIKHYPNANDYKYLIYKENLRKPGVYLWTNLITGEFYIGSSIDLTSRLRRYYSLICLKISLDMADSKIYESFLNYGHSNFSLDILEYCEPNLLLKREQYYLDLLNPKYNICKKAGSTFGKKHSLKTKNLISNSMKNYSNKIIRIKVINLETKNILYFSNNLEAGKYFGRCERTLRKYKNEKKLFLSKYLIINNQNN